MPFLCEDLQNVNITLRILFRPIPKELPKLYTSLGEDYDERVLPSITNEILKAVVVSPNIHYSLSMNHLLKFLTLGSVRCGRTHHSKRVSLSESMRRTHRKSQSVRTYFR